MAWLEVRFCSVQYTVGDLQQFWRGEVIMALTADYHLQDRRAASPSGKRCLLATS